MFVSIANGAGHEYDMMYQLKRVAEFRTTSRPAVIYTVPLISLSVLISAFIYDMLHFGVACLLWVTVCFSQTC